MKKLIKICGITSIEDADFCLKNDVDILGFNLYKNSKRFIGFDQVLEIIEDIKISFQSALVFVNEDKGFVSECLREIPNAIPQFHGDESAEYCESFGQDFIKAIRVNKDSSLPKIFNQYSSATMMLLDSFSQKEYGGTGLSFDWDLINKDLTNDYLLAGGLNPENLKEAIKRVGPIGYDLNSGVELSPGLKNKMKIKECVDLIRGTDD